MEENERYDEVCKPAFERMEKAQQRGNEGTEEILRILKGQNGNPGLLDEVRDLKRFRRGIVGAFCFVLTVLFVQGIAWIRGKFGG